MYCLRYFLIVLLFFPFPIAPPFLILLFLISMTLEHKPCAYCSLLLSAILMSTCSWNIASLDVSPVYKTSTPISKLNNQQQTLSFIKSIISFFTSSKFNKQDGRNLNLKQEEEQEVIVTNVGFESLTSKLNQQNQDEKWKINNSSNNSFNRCWCFSNFGKLFQPVSIRNSNRPHQQQQQQQQQRQEEKLKYLRHDDVDHSSDRDHIKKDQQNFGYNSIVTTRRTNDKDDDDDDERDCENEQEEGLPLKLNEGIKKTIEIGKPKRQLKTLLSPLWKPLTKLTKTIISTQPEQDALPRSRTSIKTMTQKEKEKKSTRSSDPPPTRTYRSSFSRTPLVYSHIIEPSINFIKSKLDDLSVPILHRLFIIFKYNLYELWSQSHKIPIPTSHFNYNPYLTSSFFSAFFNQFNFVEFFKLSYSRYYLENKPFEIRLIGLSSLVNINKSSLGLRIFLGSRPLSSSSSPSSSSPIN